MSTQIPLTFMLVIILITMLGACDNRAAQMLVDAEKCDEQRQAGNLQNAEILCTRALGDANELELDPDTRSSRLYELGSIKRQLSKFKEGEELLRQSLAIEEEMPSSQVGVALRLYELSLVLAGQSRWQEGTHFLERTIPLANHLDANQQNSLAQTLKHYARRMESEQPQTASRFRIAANEMGEQKSQ